MNEIFNTNAYNLLSEFMRAVNTMSKAVLLEKFGITETILEEIQEALEDYFDGKQNISMAPMDMAFSEKVYSRPYIAIHEMNSPRTWDVECIILANNKASEAILHVELFENNNSLKLRYKYIGS